MDKKVEAYLALGNSYRHLYPERAPRPTVSERDRLIYAGLLKPGRLPTPLQNWRKAPVLELRDGDGAYVLQHLDKYWLALEAFEVGNIRSSDPRQDFWQQDPRVM